MKFGKTYKDKSDAINARLVYLKDKEEKGWVFFAYLPIKLSNGRYAWLEKVKKYRKHYSGSYSHMYYDPFPFWCYEAVS